MCLDQPPEEVFSRTAYDPRVGRQGALETGHDARRGAEWNSRARDRTSKPRIRSSIETRAAVHTQFKGGIDADDGNWKFA